MGVEDTSKRDPLLHLAAVWPKPGQTGQDAITNYVTSMEAAGQRQLVNSNRLPVDLGIMAGPEERTRYEVLGFRFGDPDPDDPLFMPATLPDGWLREGSSHAMWSYLLDERGIRRVAIFYKAAFYDRRAHMSLINVGRDLGAMFIYWSPEDGPEPAIPWGRLTAEEVADVRTAGEEYLKDVDRNPDVYGDRADRARLLLEQAKGR